MIFRVKYEHVWYIRFFLSATSLSTHSLLTILFMKHFLSMQHILVFWLLSTIRVLCISHHILFLLVLLLLRFLFGFASSSSYLPRFIIHKILLLSFDCLNPTQRKWKRSWTGWTVSCVFSREVVSEGNFPSIFLWPVHVTQRTAKGKKFCKQCSSKIAVTTLKSKEALRICLHHLLSSCFQLWKTKLRDTTWINAFFFLK